MEMVGLLFGRDNPIRRASSGVWRLPFSMIGEPTQVGYSGLGDAGASLV